jgi:hypothetical protein
MDVDQRPWIPAAQASKFAACLACWLPAWLYTCGRSITRDWTAAARAQMIDRPQGACLLEPAAVSLSSSSQQLSSMLSS